MLMLQELYKLLFLYNIKNDGIEEGTKVGFNIPVSNTLTELLLGVW